MLDKDENGVFEVELTMRDLMPADRLVPIIQDLRREPQLRRVFEVYGPEVVIHAAAHKHVPLLEAHVVEAVDNNILGTDLLLALSVEFGVGTFVMLSTDKAVNPTNVMGATKRIAEMLVQVAAQQGPGRFSCVRFGNVLESRGSVVPIFRRQIAKGGPVTVTHVEVTRYFMTVGEAAQLIIEAGSLGRRGEIFVLDMGEPVRVIDLARDLIRLSMPGRADTVPIEIIGLRPGEKMHEELLIAEEGTRATKFHKILVAPQRTIAPEVMRAALDRIRKGVAAQNEGALVDAMERIGAGYRRPASSGSRV
jgi:FlaA1/EpsC-like NDP-sugar epimerase